MHSCLAYATANKQRHDVDSDITLGVKTTVVAINSQLIMCSASYEISLAITSRWEQKSCQQVGYYRPGSHLICRLYLVLLEGLKPCDEFAVWSKAGFFCCCCVNIITGGSSIRFMLFKLLE
jgi:hypothetical protein